MDPNKIVKKGTFDLSGWPVEEALDFLEETPSSHYGRVHSGLGVISSLALDKFEKIWSNPRCSEITWLRDITKRAINGALDLRDMPTKEALDFLIQGMPCAHFNRALDADINSIIRLSVFGKTIRQFDLETDRLEKTWSNPND